MCCVLRAGHETFDVDGFLRESPWKTAAVFHAGEKRRITSRISKVSGFNLNVSQAEFGDLDRAVTDSLAFLEREANEIARLARAVGPGGFTLDFAMNYDVERWPFFWRRFPLALVQAAAKAGANLELSFYPRSPKERDADASSSTAGPDKG